MFKTFSVHHDCVNLSPEFNHFQKAQPLSNIPFFTPSHNPPRQPRKKQLLPSIGTETLTKRHNSCTRTKSDRKWQPRLPPPLLTRRSFSSSQGDPGHPRGPHPELGGADCSLLKDCKCSRRQTLPDRGGFGRAQRRWIPLLR